MQQDLILIALRMSQRTKMTDVLALSPPRLTGRTKFLGCHMKETARGTGEEEEHVWLVTTAFAPTNISLGPPSHPGGGEATALLETQLKGCIARSSMCAMSSIKPLLYVKWRCLLMRCAQDIVRLIDQPFHAQAHDERLRRAEQLQLQEEDDFRAFLIEAVRIWRWHMGNEQGRPNGVPIADRRPPASASHRSRNTCTFPSSTTFSAANTKRSARAQSEFGCPTHLLWSRKQAIFA